MIVVVVVVVTVIMLLVCKQHAGTGGFQEGARKGGSGCGTAPGTASAVAFIVAIHICFASYYVIRPQNISTLIAQNCFWDLPCTYHVLGCNDNPVPQGFVSASSLPMLQTRRS